MCSEDLSALLRRPGTVRPRLPKRNHLRMSATEALDNGFDRGAGDDADKTPSSAEDVAAA